MVDDVEGVVEEIGLTYTFIRAEDDTRCVIPNEKLASDTIRNLTIRSSEKAAEITVQIPLDQDLDAALEALRTKRAATSTSARSARRPRWSRCGSRRRPDDADRLARELRVRAHRRLRAAGVFA